MPRSSFSKWCNNFADKIRGNPQNQYRKLTFEDKLKTCWLNPIASAIRIACGCVQVGAGLAFGIPFGILNCFFCLDVEEDDRNYPRVQDGPFIKGLIVAGDGFKNIFYGIKDLALSPLEIVYYPAKALYNKARGRNLDGTLAAIPQAAAPAAPVAHAEPAIIFVMVLDAAQAPAQALAPEGAIQVQAAPQAAHPRLGGV